jgi:hypothetical protein
MRCLRAVLVPALVAALSGLAPPASAADDSDVTPLLRRIPGVARDLSRLPPFIRDTDLRLHLRTYYLNERNANDTISEAWAGGGWLSYRSGWLLDTFRMGATVFTSAPFYAPADRDGTLLLERGQRGFIVPGIAFGALRYGEYALLTGYRQLVEQTYVNPHDNRMVPQTFEGVTLGGKVDFAEYLVGYLTGMKTRGSETFVSMAEAAGVARNDGGLVLAGTRLTPLRGLTLELSNQFGNDVFNTAYGRIEYVHAFSPDLAVTLSGHYTDQRAVGEALLGGSKFKHWVTSVGGMRAQLHYRDLTLTGAFEVTGKGNNIQVPFGAYPGYLHMIVRDFNRAGEVGWLAGFSYDFSRWLPETKVVFAFAQGTNTIDPIKRTPQPTMREHDLGIDYRAPKRSALRGFGVQVVGGVLHLGAGPTPLYQLRLILNYEIPLL